MKRLTAYAFLILILGAIVLVLAHRAQTQNVPVEDTQPETNVPAATLGGATTPVFSYQGQLLDAQGNPVTGNTPMTFRIFPSLTGGTACWTEQHTGANAVAVQGGRFSLLLGSITPTDPGCLAEDGYLELEIDGETLSPRQLLTDAIVSNGSQLGSVTVGQHLFFDTYSSNGIDRAIIHGRTGGALWLDADSSPLYPPNPTWTRGSRIALASLDNSTFSGSVRIHIAKDNNLGNSPVLDVIRIQNDGVSEELLKVDENGNLTANGRIYTRNGADLGLQDTGGGYLSLGNNPGDNKIYLEAFSNDGTGSADEFLVTGRFAVPMPLFTIRANQTNISGNLNIGGTCNASMEGGDEVAGAGETCTAVRISDGSIQTGAIIEANLMTAAERAAGRIDRFEQGDLLCWSAADMHLEKCSQANDSLVQAVAGVDGRPIIAGAEPIKVIGPVQAGDYLVASAVPGYARVAKDPTFGIVIAQALEDFNGERGLILAFIRKM